jgi:hypothetical protein
MEVHQGVEDIAAMFHETAAGVVCKMLAKGYALQIDDFNRVYHIMKEAGTWKSFIDDAYREFNKRGRVLRKQDEPTAPGRRLRMVYEMGDFSWHELWRFVDVFSDHLRQTINMPAADQTAINQLLEMIEQPVPLDVL